MVRAQEQGGNAPGTWLQLCQWLPLKAGPIAKAGHCLVPSIYYLQKEQAEEREQIFCDVFSNSPPILLRLSRAEKTSHLKLQQNVRKGTGSARISSSGLDKLLRGRRS